MTTKEIEKSESKFLMQFIATCLIVILTIIGTYFFVIHVTKSPDEPGTFGDLFGVTTCLFSGLAFSGLLYTLQIQKLELRITREELKQTADANKVTAEATLKSLEVQKLSTIISGRKTILEALMNNHLGNLVVGENDNMNDMIRRYSEEVKKALNTLESL